MKEKEENHTGAANAGADAQPPAREPYVKPESTVVELELEQPILVGSGNNFGNGGRW